MTEIDSGNLDPKVEQIIGQYRKVAAAFGVMFAEIGLRTEWDAWRFDGIGSCGITKNVAEIGIVGVAKDEILRLREEINEANDMSRVDGKLSCPYHRENFGCVLGDLKSPLCISYIESADEVAEKFDINSSSFKQFVYSVFRRILFAGEEDENMIKPEDNEEFVNGVLEKISKITENIRRTPKDSFSRMTIISIRQEYA